VTFRRQILLPRDNGLYAWQDSLPHLTRSTVHRCDQPHGLSRLPEVEGDKPAKRKFQQYPLGDFPITMVEVHTADGLLSLVVAVDRASTCACAELHAAEE
jgi:hypothetical protein